ncbi:class I SAM-dependent methyltransferase [Mesorhizobium sp. M0847]|uniref:class I SAM-dependent methyltransferase n=1 Tax=unclassified Mesorhizobium TaxID=325217 RepID=UPI00333DA74D
MAYVDIDRAAVPILDAGCGTGLVGCQLVCLGFQSIDGFDLSEAMAENAGSPPLGKMSCRHVWGASWWSDRDCEREQAFSQLDSYHQRGRFNMPPQKRGVRKYVAGNFFGCQSIAKSMKLDADR